METGKFSEELEIALSGGGFRATAFGLGVLLYIVDSRLNQRVKSIVSVSGGSITNGFVASECDFAALKDKENFRRIAAELAQIISGKGKYSGFWLVSRPYLAILFLSGAALFAWFTNMIITLFALIGWDVELRQISIDELIMFLIVALLWGTAALLRGELVRRWILRLFFHKKLITLGLLKNRCVDHVFCATDLTSSVPIFFSTKGGGRVFSERYGRGEGKDIPIAMAVAASAAFPPLIPPMRLKLGGRGFGSSEIVPHYIYLSDGGVWNNLGTDWSRLRSPILTAEMNWIKNTHTSDEPNAVIKSLQNCPMGGVLLIANASKPEKRKNLFMIKIPVLSFITTLIRVLNVTVNSTVEARSADIERTARMRMLNDPDRWELGQDAQRPKNTVWGENIGTDPPLAVMVEMTRKPGETASSYKMIGGLMQWEQRPDEYEQELEAPLHKLKPLLEGEDIVPTTLDNLGPHDTLRMIVLGYLNARETLSVAFSNHNPPPIPNRKWFDDLLVPGRIGGS